MSTGTQAVGQGVAQPGNGNNVRCFVCNVWGHKKTECPNIDRSVAGVCFNCKNFHPYHVACHARGYSNVYATAVNQNVCERENAKYCHEGPLDQFELSVVINGESVTAIRDILLVS